MKYLRGFLWILSFFVVKSGVQLMGFDDSTGTMFVIVGVAMMTGLFFWGRAAKKAAAKAAAIAPQA